MEIFAFCVTTFEPILGKTCQVPQNDRQSPSFVKDKHTYGEKMARQGLKKVIYKGAFVSKQSLVCVKCGIEPFQVSSFQKFRLLVYH